MSSPVDPALDPVVDPDDVALDPAAMLALSEAQATRASLAFAGPVAGILAAWAIAWGIGFLAIWLTADSPGTPGLLEPAVGIVVFAVLTVVAIVLSGILGVKASSGLRGASDFAGTVYGVSWPVSMSALVVLGIALDHAGATHDVLWVFYPAAYAIVVGILYFVGAAIWRAVPQLVLGAWLILCGAGTALLGFPANLLAMSVLAGGGLAVGAVVLGIALARSKSAVRHG